MYNSKKQSIQKSLGVVLLGTLLATQNAGAYAQEEKTSTEKSTQEAKAQDEKKDSTVDYSQLTIKELGAKLETAEKKEAELKDKFEKAEENSKNKTAEVKKISTELKKEVAETKAVAEELRKVEEETAKAEENLKITLDRVYGEDGSGIFPTSNISPTVGADKVDKALTEKKEAEKKKEEVSKKIDSTWEEQELLASKIETKEAEKAAVKATNESRKELNKVESEITKIEDAIIEKEEEVLEKQEAAEGTSEKVSAFDNSEVGEDNTSEEVVKKSGKREKVGDGKKKRHPINGSYTTTSPYGVYRQIGSYSDVHNGIDWVTGRANEKIYSADKGVVTFAGYDGYGGLGVIVKHPDGYYSYYWHLAHGSLTVNVGDQVEAGEMVGIMGTTGLSTGVHLHFQVGTDGNHGPTVDPVAWLNGKL